MTGRRLRSAGLALLVLLTASLLGGCAQPPPRPDSDTAFWQGRLALRIDSPTPQTFSVGFELEGSVERGALRLSGPLGQTVAQLAWRPGSATLREHDGAPREFDSLDRLAAQATGTPLPIAALFEWLAGRAASADGWQADLSRLHEGRLSARRARPEPAAELRLVLEPPPSR